MKKLTNLEVSKLFKQYGCELLGNYTNIYTPVNYRCSCGNVGKISIKKFKLGQRCRACKYRKTGEKLRPKYEEIQSLFQAQGCVLLSQEYKNCFQLLDYTCSCGNVSKICLSNFKRGHRCKLCGVCRGENNYRWNTDREFVAHAEKIRKKCYGLLHRTLDAINDIKRHKTEKVIGYGPSELHEWLRQHEYWNEIKNTSWHLDHIFPIKAFVD